MQKLLLFLTLSCYLIFTGCAAVVAGAGAGAGAYAYMNGELRKSYRATFDKTVQVSAETLKNMHIVITQELPDSGVTLIQATQADGTPVTLKIEMITPDETAVSVRSGVFGIWEKHVSEMIHARIARRL